MKKPVGSFKRGTYLDKENLCTENFGGMGNILAGITGGGGPVIIPVITRLIRPAAEKSTFYRVRAGLIRPQQKGKPPERLGVAGPPRPA